ncbi:hypothetical protein PF010_g15209 [Phytophthora fragariae]|uniref:Uncharacterized protein n=1 Tax=Phytophthora fragariae TaxID=53985 RepID=A0A6G0KV85_9STRA|nr:hypothetical protein PF010_g15209 [Phytophthora fragariae]
MPCKTRTLPESNANDARGGDGRASRRLPELDAAFMKLGQMIVDTEVLVVHPCDKLVESKCPGDTRRISYTTGKFSKARFGAPLRVVGGAGRGEE